MHSSYDSDEEQLFAKDSEPLLSYEQPKSHFRSDSTDSFELKQRGKAEKVQERKPSSKATFADHLLYEIQEGDTLQKLSLRCGCSIPELKVANNFISDQEFYGLRLIKIPVKRYGILSEVFAQQVQNKQENEAKPVFVNIGLKKTFENDKKDLKRFLNHLDDDLKSIRKVAESYEHAEDGDVMRHAPQAVNDYCGLTWRSVICLAISICIIIPLVYAFLVEEAQ